MIANLIQIAGLGCLVEAANLYAGRATAFVVGGVCLLFIGAFTESDAVLAKITRQMFAVPVRIGARAYGRGRTALQERREIKTMLRRDRIAKLLSGE